MFVPRKSHPKINEYHTMCCGETRIMYRWYLDEGKDRPEDSELKSLKQEWAHQPFNLCVGRQNYCGEQGRWCAKGIRHSMELEPNV